MEQRIYFCTTSYFIFLSFVEMIGGGGRCGARGLWLDRLSPYFSLLDRLSFSFHKCRMGLCASLFESMVVLGFLRQVTTIIFLTALASPRSIICLTTSISSTASAF